MVKSFPAWIRLSRGVFYHLCFGAGGHHDAHFVVLSCHAPGPKIWIKTIPSGIFSTFLYIKTTCFDTLNFEVSGMAIILGIFSMVLEWGHCIILELSATIVEPQNFSLSWKSRTRFQNPRQFHIQGSEIHLAVHQATPR